MSLVADYNSSDGSDSSSDDSEESCDETSIKLTIPAVLFQKSKETGKSVNVQQRKLSQTSVYSNPFAQSEANVQQTLSKHKELSENMKEEKKGRERKKKFEKDKKKQKICVHFFKNGTCKYGKDCKFSHSLLTQSEPAVSTEEDKQADYTSQPELHKNSKKRTHPSFAAEGEVDFGDGDEETTNRQIKKRPGLGNDIVPGKKILKTYHKLYK